MFFFNKPYFIILQIGSGATYICHSCWVRADRDGRHFVSRPSTSSASSIQEQGDRNPVIPVSQPTSRSSETIMLPNYVRAVDTESRCFIEGCQGRDRHRVPLNKRIMLLNTYSYYVPQNNRLCNQHLNIESWDFLNGMLDNYINTFTASHLEDMLALKGHLSSTLDFANLTRMDDHLVYHWIGMNKEQFNIILNEVPQLNQMRCGTVGLAAYLIKLRTGDSNERISSLLNIPRRTLDGYITTVRDLMHEYFVPEHFGLHHINRQQIVQRTLLLPRGLFSHHNGEDRPVVIIDGTYCYIQKSSNYLYQKRTYSLHKYQNLVKPFLIVCPDGYIVDVMGPYPATSSDADIMRREFQNENSMLREYFQPGDAFILDRGFRDALPFLNNCGYRTYVPASLQEGEWQLSTLEANKSRAVTICRWVVEVVNGRFKRDFKLLRQDYFNTASKHLMKDFKVAAALLNAFHPPITNRADAEDILRIINEKMYVDNILGDYVIRNNLNRRRANFQRINVQNNDLRDFPQLTHNELALISLGSYQIKQARSYYGEHIRDNGIYEIEVCHETDSDLLTELSATTDSLWLLRGRIKSRHISSKTYFTYILVDGSVTGREAIKQYYCNCIVGKRTVGCCCHIMSIIWYLSWARYQETVIPPAQFLDDILITYDEAD